MAYIQVEASVRTHKKFLKAGPAASWLWLCGMGYCQDGLTDGFIPFEAIDYLGVKPTIARKLKSVLVAERLWHDVAGGWRVHDYLEHNRAAVEVKATRERRRAGGALGGRPTKETLDETLEVNGKVNLPVNHPVNLSENPSVLSSSQQSSATATTGGLSAPQRTPIHTSHKKHVLCGRVCLHADQFGEFVRRRNHDGAHAEVLHFAQGVIDEWTTGAHAKHEPGDGFDFWRARYAERWPAERQAQANPNEPEWARKWREKKAAAK